MAIRNWKKWFASEKKSVQAGTRLRVEQLEDRCVPTATPTVNLTTVGASGWVNGAEFVQNATQPDGSGVIGAFVRLQSHNQQTVEQGYNTDARPLQFDEKTSASFTHSVHLSQIPAVNIGGVEYREFLLDAVQNQASPLLSLDELRFYTSSSTGALTGYDPTSNTLGGQSPVYDLGAGNSILLNTALNPGSGRGNMLVYVPDQMFQTGGDPYVYLYSKFGVSQPANGGYEQWAFQESRATGPASLSGFAFASGTNAGIAGVRITLTDEFGNTWTTTTGANGAYSFTGLGAGTYTLTATVPNGFTIESSDLAGTVNGLTDGVSSTDPAGPISDIILAAGQNGINYDFWFATVAPPNNA